MASLMDRLAKAYEDRDFVFSVGDDYTTIETWCENGMDVVAEVEMPADADDDAAVAEAFTSYLDSLVYGYDPDEEFDVMWSAHGSLRGMPDSPRDVLADCEEQGDIYREWRDIARAVVAGEA